MGGFIHGHWDDTVSAEEAARRDAGAPAAPTPARSSNTSTATPGAVPAPAQMPTGQDTNTYAGRQALRDAGYYIDDSGVYAPGAGQRVGDTWSGGNAGRNTAPSPTRLPIIGGTPISPSSGFTGPQTGAIMYRGDPQYNALFGPGTPGYSSRDPSYNGGALPAGQQTLADWTAANPRPPTAAASAPAAQGAPAETPAPATAPAYAGVGSLTAADGQTLSAQPDGVRADFVARYGQDQAEQAWVQEHNVSIGASAQAAPQPAVNQATGTPQVNPPPSVNNTTAAPPPSGGKQERTWVGADGKVMTANLTDEDFRQVQADRNKMADDIRAAQLFTQGLENRKLDMQQALNEWTKAYQQALLAQNDRAAAQQAAFQAMQINLQQQAQELARQAQAATLSTEHERLALQRQQLRGGRRSRALRFA